MGGENNWDKILTQMTGNPNNSPKEPKFGTKSVTDNAIPIFKTTNLEKSFGNRMETFELRSIVASEPEIPRKKDTE